VCQRTQEHQICDLAQDGTQHRIVRGMGGGRAVRFVEVVARSAARACVPVPALRSCGGLMCLSRQGAMRARHTLAEKGGFIFSIPHSVCM
jgi:hypothetical protein